MPKSQDLPPCPDVPAERSSARTTREYRVSLVTPLFGGGAEAGKPDATLPIRGTAVRGQLQFWWRATRGAGFASHEQLFARHAEVWGTTERASPVEIEVRDARVAHLRPCARYEWSPNARHGQGAWRLRWEPPFASSPLSYALFPFQGKPPASGNSDPEEAPASFIETGSFVLRTRYPEPLRQEVQTAIWAWANFGGLGARTRRGCGALLCNDLSPKSTTDLQSWFRTGTGRQEAATRDWPTLPASALVAEEVGTSLEAWKKVIGLLQRFRQGAGFARNPGQGNRPGRSRYPEPETIRSITGRRSLQHARLSHIPDAAFPRAELGLPIVFHYQGQGEPPDTGLYPASGPDGQPRDRMASPLILKPLALANGRAVPLILRLVTAPLAGVDLRQGEQSLGLPAPAVIRDTELASYPDSPLAGSETGSALDAFIALARQPEHGFRELAR
jgi:CRISPR-associated protein Cmr1